MHSKMGMYRWGPHYSFFLQHTCCVKLTRYLKNVYLYFKKNAKSYFPAKFKHSYRRLGFVWSMQMRKMTQNGNGALILLKESQQRHQAALFVDLQIWTKTLEPREKVFLPKFLLWIYFFNSFFKHHIYSQTL